MKLYNDDCLKVLPTIPDKSIDLVLTDQPYGTTQCKWDSVIPFEPMWKELKRIILKLFLVICYLSLGTIFVYITFNNSFWLIDNGNSGFVGKIGYNFLSSWFPWTDEIYTTYGLLLLTMALFIFSSDISFKKIFSGLWYLIVSLF